MFSTNNMFSTNYMFSTTATTTATTTSTNQKKKKPTCTSIVYTHHSDLGSVCCRSAVDGDALRVLEASRTRQAISHRSCIFGQNRTIFGFGRRHVWIGILVQDLHEQDVLRSRITVADCRVWTKHKDKKMYREFLMKSVLTTNTNKNEEKVSLSFWNWF